MDKWDRTPWQVAGMWRYVSSRHLNLAFKLTSDLFLENWKPTEIGEISSDYGESSGITRAQEKKGNQHLEHLLHPKLLSAFQPTPIKGFIEI